MSTSTPHRLIVAVLLLIAAALASISSVAATDHIVGANRGWNPGINYTLWANNHTFYVGDLISFRYQKMQYNVFEVNQTGYDNCTIEGAVGNWSSGKDFVLLDKAKRYYFICGTGGCYNGMKVSVVVHPLPSPPSSAAVAAEHSSPTSAAAEVFRHRPGPSVVAKVVMAVFASIWFGWI
uniref:Putative Early nodulin-like protein 17 isoform 2 n=1 Tax=Davidia involucrata TaxID=16924 RepID=A0A5B7A647_DAVIN